MLAAPQPTVAVAFSGGRDSLALLHATCRSAQALGLQVAALHIHHNLLPEADAWLTSAQALCARWHRRGWPLQLHWARLEGSPAAGDSLEAWARRGRYAELTRLAQHAGATLLLLAHHRQDQAETVLLQALRGAGPAGLSAMPVLAQRGALAWARPWLTQPPRAIDAYVHRHRLRPVQDPSNHDAALARSRLRSQVWPAFTAAFADGELALIGVAARAQEAATALAELATLDLASCAADSALQVGPWRTLSAARQANALRHWWRAQTGRGLPETLLRRLVAELRPSGAARWPAGPGWQAVLYRGTLLLVADPPRPLGAAVTQLDLSVPGRTSAPGWGGAFEVVDVPAGGLPAASLAQVALRPRSGAERFQAEPHRPPRSLKKQYQAAGVPAHARQGPLLWDAGGCLMWVPQLGPDARCLAMPGVAQLLLRWLPDAAPAGSLSGRHKLPG